MRFDMIFWPLLVAIRHLSMRISKAYMKAYRLRKATAPDQAMLHAIPHTGAFALPDGWPGHHGRFDPQHGTTKLA